MLSNDLPYLVQMWCVLCGWQFAAEDLSCPCSADGCHLVNHHYDQLPDAERERITGALNAGQFVVYDHRMLNNAWCIFCGTDLRRSHVPGCYYPRPHLSVQAWNGLTDAERHTLYDTLRDYVADRQAVA